MPGRTSGSQYGQKVNVMLVMVCVHMCVVVGGVGVLVGCMSGRSI